MSWCGKCGAYSVFDNSHKCNKITYAVSCDEDFVPDDDDCQEDWFSGDTESVAEKIAEKAFRDDPDELCEHYVFIKENKNILKFTVFLEPNIHYSAKERE